jgi:DNA-binding winged helix-turn-helix (wHTH) protein
MGTILRFDVFEFDTHALELRRAGEPVYLRPQPSRLLRCLARRPGVLLTRDELRNQLWPAGMFVRFDQGLNSCMKQVRAALGDQHERPQFIETLPRRGYRFLVPVTEAAAIATTRRTHLAVLPFRAIDAGIDAAPPLITDGFAEELTSRLAGLRPDRLGVLECPAAEHHENGRPGTACRELGPDYLVKGTIRRAGSRLRVTASLISVIDKTHLWVPSYERDVYDPLLWQDEAASTIAKEIVGTLRLPATS